jgi:signal transduction histidine kinase/CheY-like chemotaxis protein
MSLTPFATARRLLSRIAGDGAKTKGKGAEASVLDDRAASERREAARHQTSKLARLGRMSASLVHEISQPVTIIRLTAEDGLAHLGRQPFDSADMEARLRVIAEQAARLSATIDLMQAFSHRDVTPAAAGESCFDVVATTAEAIDQERRDSGRAGVTLEAVLPAEPVLAAGRDRLFEQVLHNLLANAIHALSDLPAGRRRLIRVTLEDQSQDSAEVCPCIRLCVDDSGPGIPADARAAVFEPFHTTKPPGHGTGLGLYISRGLIRAMGGRLTVGDSPLGGARFEVRLPAASSLPACAGGSPAAHRPHILVVDAAAPARRDIRAGLEACGFAVSEAATGHDALAALRRCNGGDPRKGCAPIDAVLAGLRKPGGPDGGLLRGVAADYPHVFTLVMTGPSPEDHADPADLGGADAVLRKPISPKDLCRRLTTLLAAQTGDDEVA